MLLSEHTSKIKSLKWTHPYLTNKKIQFDPDLLSKIKLSIYSDHCYSKTGGEQFLPSKLDSREPSLVDIDFKPLQEADNSKTSDTIPGMFYIYLFIIPNLPPSIIGTFTCAWCDSKND